jgi:hypothetical protein
MSASNIEIQLGIEYANHEGVSLLGDLYMPAGQGLFPTMLLIHGGAWQRSSRAPP